MIRFLLLALYVIVIDSMHFNGGTIRWVPTNPYDNSSSIMISIVQSYSWTYPTITCANNVPISTSGRSGANANLTCVVDCSTDGGYATKPVNIVTDCISASLSTRMMRSERSVNITLSAGAHFYLAYVGNAWVALNSPSVSGLQWSIVASIDLRMRPDGFINTPPTASVISPQYAIVNRTTQIYIRTSDVNVGDDVRCRWSVYVSGYRRRRRFNEEQFDSDKRTDQQWKKFMEAEEVIHQRHRRTHTLNCSANSCESGCAKDCYCTCPGCIGTTCSGTRCKTSSGCPMLSTTIDTPGPLKSTSSYPSRQAIDECGGICYPGSMPNGTTLSGCTLSFRGLVPNTWYGVAMQVSDDCTSIYSLSLKISVSSFVEFDALTIHVTTFLSLRLSFS